MSRTSGRTILVTGASRGLGRALTRALADRGDTVVVDARGEMALRAVTDQLANVTAVLGDIRDAAHRTALADAVAGRALDALVLSAATLGPSPLPSVADLSPDDLAAVLDANVVAQLRLIQALLPHLRPGAAVLGMTSDAAHEPYEGWSAYGASKAAFEQLLAIFAAERPDLRVYRIDPGDLRTAMHQAAFPGEDISDRPLPETAVPPLLDLIDGDRRSGRFRLADLALISAVEV